MSQTNNKSLKIFLWSPMLSDVGTNGAMIGMAQSLKNYSNAKIYLINVLEPERFNLKVLVPVSAT